MIPPLFTQKSRVEPRVVFNQLLAAVARVGLVAKAKLHCSTIGHADGLENVV